MALIAGFTGMWLGMWVGNGKVIHDGGMRTCQRR